MPAESTSLPTALVRRWDANARRYDRMLALEERFIGRRLRPRLWARAGTGKVLELGIGTGANLPYYPPGAEVTGVDISGEMLSRARDKAQRTGTPVSLHQMDAQSLAFPSDSFDAVVSTWVFCSVPDPVQGLREARRMLKPGGRLLMLEHVRGPGVLGRVMDWLNPLVVRLTGTSINRDTVANVRKAGLEVEEVRSFLFGIVKLIVARKAPADTG